MDHAVETERIKCIAALEATVKLYEAMEEFALKDAECSWRMRNSGYTAESWKALVVLYGGVKAENEKLRKQVELLHDAWSHAWVDVTPEDRLPPTSVFVAAAPLNLAMLELPEALRDDA